MCELHGPFAYKNSNCNNRYLLWSDKQKNDHGRDSHFRYRPPGMATPPLLSNGKAIRSIRISQIILKIKPGGKSLGETQKEVCNRCAGFLVSTKADLAIIAGYLSCNPTRVMAKRTSRFVQLFFSFPFWIEYGAGLELPIRRESQLSCPPARTPTHRSEHRRTRLA